MRTNGRTKLTYRTSWSYAQSHSIPWSTYGLDRPMIFYGRPRLSFWISLRIFWSKDINRSRMRNRHAKSWDLKIPYRVAFTTNFTTTSHNIWGMLMKLDSMSWFRQRRTLLVWIGALFRPLLYFEKLLCEWLQDHVGHQIVSHHSLQCFVMSCSFSLYDSFLKFQWRRLTSRINYEMREKANIDF